MESKVKSMGHAMHPMLVVFPLGLLITSAVFDIVHLITGNGYWSEIAFWMIAAGLIGGFVAWWGQPCDPHAVHRKLVDALACAGKPVHHRLYSFFPRCSVSGCNRLARWGTDHAAGYRCRRRREFKRP